MGETPAVMNPRFREWDRESSGKTMSLPIKKCQGGIRFSATIQPRSSKNQISGWHNDSLKIRLTSPPVDGAANRMCVKFLAKTLKISPSRVSIVAGLTGRNKTIQIESMDEAAFLDKIKPAIPPAGD